MLPSGWGPCDSTAIEAFRYLADDSVLQIAYVAGRKVYDFPCPAALYEQFVTAASKGRFVERMLRPYARQRGWSRAPYAWPGSAMSGPRRASPTAQELSSGLGELVGATLQDQTRLAAEIVSRIGHRRIEIERRPALSIAARVAIHRRDCWTCRYCQARTVAPPILRFLSEIYPEDLPYHPNWRAGQVHPAYLLVSASVDHVDPGGRGGSWLGEDNLVTACWPCNTGKADLRLEEVGWELLDVETVQSDWDGLSGVVELLWARAGSPAIYRDWRGALTRPSEQL
jgi:hypothetical protein